MFSSSSGRRTPVKELIAAVGFLVVEEKHFIKRLLMSMG